MASTNSVESRLIGILLNSMIRTVQEREEQKEQNEEEQKEKKENEDKVVK